MKTQVFADLRNGIANVREINEEIAVGDEIWIEKFLSDDRDLLQLFLRELSKFPLLKQGKIAKLITLAQLGDVKARDSLLEHNLRLVVWVARQYSDKIKQNCTISLLDLIQEGVFGLNRAIELYDKTLGTKFSTYAVIWIHQKVSRAIGDLGRIIRLPAHIGEKFCKLAHARTKLLKELNREPTNEEIAKEMETSIEDIVILKDISMQNFNYSLDSHMYREENDSIKLSEIIAGYQNEGPREIDNADLRNEVSITLKKLLMPREHEIMSMRFGLGDDHVPKTLEEIGEKYGVTRERIRQIESKVLDKISYLPNFVRTASALGIRINKEIVVEARRRMKAESERKKMEIILELQKFYKLETPEKEPERTMISLHVSEEENSPSYSVIDIIKGIADFFKVDEALIYGETRKDTIVYIRSVVSYVLKDSFNLSYADIGSILGGRDHSTIMSECKKIENLFKKQDIKLITELNQIKEIILV